MEDVAAAVLDQLEGMVPAMVDDVGALVRIPSVGGTDAEHEAQAAMARRLADGGLDVDHWPIELDVITAVVLGGTSIFGGRGRIIGTVLGLLLIHETRQFISWHFQDENLIFVVIGVLLICSVLLNTLLTPRTRE